MPDCSHVIVHCIDFRTQRATRRLRRSLGVSERDCDRVSVAGGAANLDQLEVNLSLSHRLHHSTTAILTIHEDCGAGAKVEDLHKAAKIALRIGYQVRLFIIKLDKRRWEEIPITP